MSANQTTSLTDWVQSHLSQLYTSTQPDDHLLNSIFTPSAEFSINHKQVERQSLLNDWQMLQVAGPGTALEWKHVTELQKNMSNPTAVRVLICRVVQARSGPPLNIWTDNRKAGIVAGVISVTRTLQIWMHSAPGRTHSTVTFSAKYDIVPKRSTRH